MPVKHMARSCARAINLTPVVPADTLISLSVLGDPGSCTADDVVRGRSGVERRHHDFPEVSILEPQPGRISIDRAATQGADAPGACGTALAMIVHVGTLPTRHGP
jgi:hypothetical protein